VIDWNEMVVFVRVVEEGSFVGAARALGVPKSTVSRRIAALEDRLGARLLHRTTRVVRATAVGQSYFERCASLVAEAAEAERLVTSAQEVPRGRMRLTTSVLFGHRWLSPLVSEFLQQHPEVEIDLVLANRFVELVDEGFDLAIRAGTLGNTEIVARKLGPVYMTMVASPDFLRQQSIPTRAEELSTLPCILVGVDNSGATWQIGGRRVSVSGPLRVNDMQLARDAAVAGIGVAKVPSFLVGDDLDAGRLVRVLPELRRENTGVYAVYPTRRHVSPSVRAFVELCLERFAGRPPWLLADDPE